MMLLKITKSHKKGLMGGSAFELQPKLTLTEDEESLINRYGLHQQPLSSRNESVITVQQLMSGDKYKCKSLAEAIDYKEHLIKSCKVLKSFLIAAASFEGIEEIEFNELLSDVEHALESP